MADVPASGQGLTWIAAHGTAHLAFISGVRWAPIVAASLGDQQALAYLISRVQEHAAVDQHNASPSPHRDCKSSAPEAGRPHRPANAGHGSTQLSPAHEGAGHSCREQAQLEACRDNTAKLLQKAAEQGEMASMRWLLALCHLSLHADGGAAMTAAAGHGNLEMLKLLQSGPHPAPWGSMSEPGVSDIIRAAFPHPVCLRWLLARDIPTHRFGFRSSWLATLIRNGHLQSLECLVVHFGFPAGTNPTQCMKVAVEHGRLPMVQYLWGQFPASEWPATVCSSAARHGHLHVLQWLRAQDPPCQWDADSTESAAHGGHLTTLQWLLAQDPPCPLKTDCMNLVAYMGHLPMLEYLHSVGHSLDGSLYYHAVVGSRPHILQWLHRQAVPAPESLPPLFSPGQKGVRRAKHSLVMFIADIGAPLPDTALPKLMYARRRYCTFHGLLRWCRRAVSDPSMGMDRAFSCMTIDSCGEQLLIRLSLLPQELVNKIAAMAGLQHDIW